MRMWLVPPKRMCNKHLLGEHVEMHMFIGTIKKGISIQGYLDNHLVNPKLIKLRHDKLRDEMIKRGMNHQSPLIFDCAKLQIGIVNTHKNKLELIQRCPECRKRWEEDQ